MTQTNGKTKKIRNLRRVRGDKTASSKSLKKKDKGTKRKRKSEKGNVDTKRRMVKKDGKWFNPYKVKIAIQRRLLKRKPENKENKETQRKKKLKTENQKPREIPQLGSAILAVDQDILKGHGDAKIYISDNVNVYNAPLTQVSLKTKVNSFYKMQLVEIGESFGVFTKWGRTGVTDGSYKRKSKHSESDDFRLKYPLTLKKSLRMFHKTFLDKTGVEWSDRANFVKLPRKYHFVELSTGNEDSLQKSDSNKQCTLENRVKELIELIFNDNTMKESLLECNIDLENMPLGRIDYQQILEGYEALKKVETIIEEHNELTKNGNSIDRIAKTRLVEACTKFFTIIPATNPSIIKDISQLKKRLEMMDVLMDFEESLKLRESQLNQQDKHILDKNYESLNSKIVALGEKTDEFEMVKTFISRHHDKNEWGYDIEVKNLFSVERKGELDTFEAWKNNNNRQLLWHGSRLTNFVGILSQGLRIAPPEAPKSGYLFGKGVYFANMVSKSSMYCRTSRTSTTGLLLLCEVALGDTFDVSSPYYMDKAMPGTFSTHCIGAMSPNPNENRILPGGCVVPLGTKQHTTPKQQDPYGSSFGYTMQYEEFIVYDTSQIKVKYLVETDFKYLDY